LFFLVSIQSTLSKYFFINNQYNYNIYGFLTLFNYFVVSKCLDCQLDESGKMLNIYSLVFYLVDIFYLLIYLFIDLIEINQDNDDDIK
jgi:hypothetical protein